MKTLQQRIVQISRDACPLVDAFFQAHIELPRHLLQPQLIERDEQCQKGGDARQTEPVSLIVGWGDVQSDRSFWPVPQPLAVAGDKPESIGAGPKVRVNGFSRCNRLAPGTVETFEKISKANPPGRREAQPRVLKRDSPGRWRNSNGGGEVCGVVIGRDRLYVRQRGN